MRLVNRLKNRAIRLVAGDRQPALRDVSSAIHRRFTVAGQNGHGDIVRDRFGGWAKQVRRSGAVPFRTDVSCQLGVVGQIENDGVALVPCVSGEQWVGGLHCDHSIGSTVSYGRLIDRKKVYQLGLYLIGAARECQKQYNRFFHNVSLVVVVCEAQHG